MDTPPRGKAKVASWIFQVLVAVIMGQTLFFKFLGAEESIRLFEALGAEPFGRYGTGVLELVAVVLLLRGRTAALGAVLTLVLMSGAIGAHVFELGIEFEGDGGALFAMAVTAFVSGGVVTFLRRGSLPLVSGLLTRVSP